MADSVALALRPAKWSQICDQFFSGGAVPLDRSRPPGRLPRATHRTSEIPSPPQLPGLAPP